MRRSPSGPPPTPASGERHDWETIKKLLPYLWAWKWRVMFALGCLISAKFANVTVPLIFKQIVDGLDISRDQAIIVVPAALLAAYGALLALFYFCWERLTVAILAFLLGSADLQGVADRRILAAAS